MALVSAHRGGAGDDRAADNTVDAFEAAIALGCDFIEFDVRLTADGRAVLSHEDVPHGDSGHRSISRLRHDEIADAGLVDLDTVLELVRGRIGAEDPAVVPAPRPWPAGRSVLRSADRGATSLVTLGGPRGVGIPPPSCAA